MHGGRGGMGGDGALHTPIGPMAVIAVFVCVIGVLIMPFRYPIITLKVLGISAYGCLLLAAGGSTVINGLVAPVLLFIAWCLSKDRR